MTADTPSIPAHFEPEAIEPRLVDRWLESGVGRADVTSTKPKFSLVMPPPNVTGQLHIGHALDMTLQDVVVRHKRQRGFDVLWLPGTDHASIATHFVVERELAKTGDTRFTLGREAFLKRARCVARPVGRHDPDPAPPPRLHAGLVARALHARSRDHQGGGPGLREDAPRGADPPRHAAGELGSQVPHRGLGPRGRDPRGRRPPLVHPLPAGRRRVAPHRGGDHPARDPVRRPGGGG